MEQISESTVLGPMLARALERLERSDEDAVLVAESHVSGATERGEWPIVAQLPPEPPNEGEGWRPYRRRVEERLSDLYELFGVMGIVPEPLIAANALRGNASVEQIAHLLETPERLRLVELDPLVQVTTMDDVADDIGLADARTRHPSLDGTGVAVAVLDSGVDTTHPFLMVAESVSTCAEPVELAGDHGTHCAGSIASTDQVFNGVAPGVRLINIKVLLQDGRGKHTDIVRGVDAALDRGANVLSMSVGFNHLPAWSLGGHGWACPDGRCPLCVAVDNAVGSDGVVVVAAAGNEHARAEAIRALGAGAEQAFDTELTCPGQARSALTVGAITKRTFLPAPTSSRGPTAYGPTKPDLCTAGVNVSSTVPGPRGADGQPQPGAPRSVLFARKDGTSMATPIVAGAVALLIQRRLDAEAGWSPDGIRNELMNDCVERAGDANVFGAGRLTLSGL